MNVVRETAARSIQRFLRNVRNRNEVAVGVNLIGTRNCH